NHQPFGDARHSTHPSPLGFEAGLIPRWSFFISNLPSVSWQAGLASSASHPQRPEFGTASSADLARALAQVVSEPIFDVPRLDRCTRCFPRGCPEPAVAARCAAVSSPVLRINGADMYQQRFVSQAATPENIPAANQLFMIARHAHAQNPALHADPPCCCSHP